MPTGFLLDLSLSPSYLDTGRVIHPVALADVALRINRFDTVRTASLPDDRLGRRFIDPDERIWGLGRSRVRPVSSWRGSVLLRRLILLSIIGQEAGFGRQFALGDPRESLGGGIDLIVIGGFWKRREFAGGDLQIAFILAHTPGDNDGAWPHVGVRNLIERLNNGLIDRHIQIENYNNRGVVTGGLNDGGKKERELAERYKKMSDTVKAKWPRTGAMLRTMAESYE